jgi:hypothetical protein
MTGELLRRTSDAGASAKEGIDQDEAWVGADMDGDDSSSSGITDRRGWAIIKRGGCFLRPELKNQNNSNRELKYIYIYIYIACNHPSITI